MNADKTRMGNKLFVGFIGVHLRLEVSQIC